MTHEGGIATPLIIHWPDQLRKQAGQILETPAYLIDILPTVIEVAQASYPAKAATGDSIFALEGKSLLPILESKTDKLHDYMFWEHQDHCAIRKGRWKAVKDLPSEQWELYDLSVDRMEENNIAVKYPDLVQELDKIWYDWARSHQVLPKKTL
jgi:arylsulfatase